MPGTLYVVATPIGNLEDITLRGLRVMREAGLIAAEDTRRTARLLRHYQIRTPTTSFHEHNEEAKTPGILARLMAGTSVALVSDAGTPTISDPGRRLVNAARDRQVRVEVVPGPSAVVTALAGSGLPADSFTFAGFPPPRLNDRKRWLERHAQTTATLVFFEAPHRILATLRQALEVWGDREVVVARELTKIHEHLVKGPISGVLSGLAAPKGEFTIVVSPRQDDTSSNQIPPVPAELYAEFCRLTNISGLSRRACVTTIARRHGWSPNQVYEAIERAKSLGQTTE